MNLQVAVVVVEQGVAFVSMDYHAIEAVCDLSVEVKQRNCRF